MSIPTAMKMLSATLLGLLIALSVSFPAFGQEGMQRGKDFAQGRRSGGMHQPMRGQQSLIDAFPGQSTPEQGVAQQRVAGQGRERLSPEERQQLRRDINAAGRDIYRRTRAE